MKCFHVDVFTGLNKNKDIFKCIHERHSVRVASMSASQSRGPGLLNSNLSVWIWVLQLPFTIGRKKLAC